MTTTTRFRDVEIRAPRGTQLNAKSWLTEAPLRMLMNNLDPDVAENPKELVVYGGIGRAARNWECFDKIVETLKNLETDEQYLRTQSEKIRERIESVEADIGNREDVRGNRFGMVIDGKRYHERSIAGEVLQRYYSEAKARTRKFGNWE